MDDDDEEGILVSEADHETPVVVSPPVFSFTRLEVLFILAITVVSLGVNFAIDVPASLEDAMSKYYNLSQYDFSLFYTSYFLPSLVLSIFGGYLIDKVLGVRMSTVLYSIVAALGLAMFVSGGILRLFWLMILGRFIFGLGCEMCSSVCMNYCTFNYFGESGRINFMFSLSDNLSYLGTLAVFQLSPALFTLFSRNYSPYKALDLVLIISSCTYLLTGSLSVYISVMGGDRAEGEDSSPRRDVQESSSRLALKDMSRFPPVFWLLCFVYWCFMNANFTFETFSQDLLTSSVYQLSVAEASDAISIMNGVKIALSVPASLLVDRMRCNMAFICVSMLLSALSYTLLVVSSVHPYITMALLGVSYTLTGSAIWAMFAYPVSKHLRGSCYGIVSAVSGLSQTLSPSVVGDLIDNFGHLAAMYFFLANASVGVLFTLITWLLDSRSGGVLNGNLELHYQTDNRSEEERDLTVQDWYSVLSESEDPP